MLGMGMGYAVVFFMAFGACIVFVIIWILQLDKLKNKYHNQVGKLRWQVETGEDQRSILFERLDESEELVNELDESLESLSVEGDGVFGGGVKDVLTKCSGLEDENKKLRDELNEAKVSLEEIYQAIHEEEPGV